MVLTSGRGAHTDTALSSLITPQGNNAMCPGSVPCDHIGYNIHTTPFVFITPLHPRTSPRDSGKSDYTFKLSFFDFNLSIKPVKKHRVKPSSIQVKHVCVSREPDVFSLTNSCFHEASQVNSCDDCERICWSGSISPCVSSLSCSQWS